MGGLRMDQRGRTSGAIASRRAGPLLRRTFAGGLLLFVWLHPAPSVAQTINGVLLERGTDQRVDLALVMLLTTDGDSVAASLSDIAGHFRLSSPEPGEFLLAVSALGYKPTVAGSVFTLGADASMNLEFRIEPMPIELGGITVETRASLANQPRLIQNGFVDRAQQGFGRFLTPEDIENSVGLSVGDLLAQTGRVTTRYSIAGEQVLMRGMRGYCMPTVYLDGRREDMSGISLDQITRVSSLEAVEVYRSASEAPMMYGGGMGGCGVIVMWTRFR